MKLKEFIIELEKILKTTKKSDQFEVRMADFIPVVKPICKNNTVFITDEENEHN